MSRFPIDNMYKSSSF